MEGTIVLGILLMVLFTMLDLGMAVLHYNSLSESARRTTRKLIVSGANAEPENLAWGPETYEGTAADDTEIGEIVRTSLTPHDVDRVLITIQWLDGTNEVGDRVQVTLRYTYLPISPFLPTGDEFEISAVSTMKIRH